MNTENITFSSLNLAPELLKALEEFGYKTPTPIQAQAIPAVLEGRDLMAGAQTGTGKTAAFSLPMLQKLLPLEKLGLITIAWVIVVMNRWNGSEIDSGCIFMQL